MGGPSQFLPCLAGLHYGPLPPFARRLFLVAHLGPDVDPFILHLFAALAQKGRALISKRTTEASAKARGVTLHLLRWRRDRPSKKRPEDERTPRQPLPLPCAGSRAGEPFLAQREAMSMTLAATAPRRPRIATMCLRPWGGYAETGRSPGYSNSYHETASMSEGVQERLSYADRDYGSRAPSEDISAGEWQRRGMMWRSLRAAPIAMLFAGMASRLRARSATFTSRMST